MIALSHLSPYLNVTKNCGTGEGCFPDVVYKRLNGADSGNFNQEDYYLKLILNDGMSSAMRIGSPNCDLSLGDTPLLSNWCGSLWVDVNGFAPPNQIGKDMFQFVFSKYGIMPQGTANYSETGGGFDSCNTTTGTGFGCAGWVVYNENLDYLHCGGLSWEGKTKCK
jgi:hypothetical protein